MLTEFILTPFIYIAKFVVSLLPDFIIDIPQNILSGFDTITNYVGYFLPIPNLLICFGIYTVFCNTRIVWAVIMRIKSFIPTMGN